MSRNQPGTPRRLSRGDRQVMDQIVVGSDLATTSSVLGMGVREVKSRTRHLMQIFKARNLEQLKANYLANRGML